MDADWRPVQGPNPAAAGSDWRAQLEPEARSRIVDTMMETLKKRLLASVPEELNELLKIAVQSEEKIYTTATNHSDYFREIYREMLSMEMETQQAPGNAQVITNQSNTGQGHAAAVDWQEETYQMIKSLKDQHFAELNELFNKVSVKLQHVDSIIPRQMPSEKYELMKTFKIMLDRILQMLLISKSTIQPALRDKVSRYEKQIIIILNSKRSLRPPTGQACNSNISQQQQPSQSLKQHDSHTNPQASLSRMSTGLQSSSAAGAGIHHVSASADNTAQTGHTGVGDWQEEAYQMVKSLKDQYFAELSKLFNKVSVKLQHVDSIIPPQEPSEKYERMKIFKIMLGRVLQVLQISKCAIQPTMRDKAPEYEKQIITILNSQRKPVQPQVQQQFQPPAGQAPNFNFSQQRQPSQSLQQHDSHTNRQESLSSMSTGLQSSNAAVSWHVPAPPTTNFSVPSQQNYANLQWQAGPDLEAAQGSNFNSLQYGSMGGTFRQGSTGPMQDTMNAQLQTGSSSMLSHISGQRKHMTKRKWRDTF